jgi:protein-S-isoprenylcysteine O-methyltransferase Ste14
MVSSELSLESSEAESGQIRQLPPAQRIVRRDFAVRFAELVVQIVAIIGATALGLGISAYFKQHPFVVAYLASYAAYRFADLLVRDPTALGIDPVRFSRRMIYELPLLALFMAAPFERTFIYGGETPRWLSGLGLLIELAGIWLALGARIQRGYFSPGADRGTGLALIKTGLYRYVRHPIFAGQLLVLIAWPFEYGAPMSFVLAAAIGFAFISRRIRQEEAEMMSEHGDAYVAYVRVTDRMFPTLW